MFFPSEMLCIMTALGSEKKGKAMYSNELDPSSYEPLF